MTDTELLALLDDLRRLPHETEWVEFKEANVHAATPPVLSVTGL